MRNFTRKKNRYKNWKLWLLLVIYFAFCVPRVGSVVINVDTVRGTRYSLKPKKHSYILDNFRHLPRSLFILKSILLFNSFSTVKLEASRDFSFQSMAIRQTKQGISKHQFILSIERKLAAFSAVTALAQSHGALHREISNNGKQSVWICIYTHCQ